jgi:hypothetical protein
MAATLATLGGPIVDGPGSAAIRGEIGVRRRGRVSCGGSCRLVDTGDGWLAVSLARRSDVEFLPRGWRTTVTVRLSWPTSRPPSWSSGLDCSGFRWRRRVNARTGLVSVGPTDRGATVQDVPWPVYAWSTSRRCGRLRSGRFRSLVHHPCVGDLDRAFTGAPSGVSVISDGSPMHPRWPLGHRPARLTPRRPA